MPVPKKAATVKINFRMPPELHGKLVRVAARNRRSLNEEMVWGLERYLNLSDFDTGRLNMLKLAEDAKAFSDTGAEVLKQVRMRMKLMESDDYARVAR